MSASLIFLLMPLWQHALASHVRLRGLDPEDVIVAVRRREGEDTWRDEDIVAAIEGERTPFSYSQGGGWFRRDFNMQTKTRRHRSPVYDSISPFLIHIIAFLSAINNLI
jgi:hypothetical protein